MNDEIKEIKINKANKSVTFINNGIAFSQFGIADEILDLITNLQQENERKDRLIEQYKEGIIAYADRNEKTSEYIEKQKKKMYKSRNKIALFILLKLEKILQNGSDTSE